MKFIWNAINTSLIFMLFMYCYLNKNINVDAMNKVNVLEKKIEAYENMHSDTIVVNVNNYISK